MAAMVPTNVQGTEESVVDLGRRLAQLLSEAGPEAKAGQLPDPVRERVADLAEAIRRRTAKRAERDPRSLFDLDERFIELMDRADDEAYALGEVSKPLLIEITEYLEAAGITVLDDSRSPQRVFLDGDFKLSDELKQNGTVPQYGGVHRCALKFKAWVIV
jgi:hypothetical protein